MLNKRILVVDDEDGVRMTLAANLELEGYQVVEATTGEEALASVRSGEPFDLVLTDIRMPGITGIELFRTLRRMKIDVPVVAMTAFAVEELIEAGLSEGLFTVLAKPFDVQQVLATVGRASRRPAVLVVDDAPQLALTTTEALRQAGLRAHAAHDGEAALRAFQADDVDLCVVDMILPGLSGPELMSRLRALDPRVVVIAISGEDVPELIRQAASAGSETFLRKPLRFPELIRAIATARGRCA